MAPRSRCPSADKVNMQEVTVRVPGSTSNLGPGFDCLGLALRIYNDVTVRRRRARALAPMMAEAGDLFFETAACETFAFTCDVSGDVPSSRGLGSSVTVRLGAVFGLNELAGRPLRREQLCELCARLEGHPDNAAPAAFGGFNVVRARAHQRFPVSAQLKLVLLVPDFEVRTADARALLPEQLPRTDAVESCGNACAITAAFASREYEHLRGAFGDHLHQPYRKRLIPFFDAVVAAAARAGALGAFLSGSGSTIAAVTLRQPKRVGDAMAAAAPRTARLIITTTDNRGARVLHSS